MMKSSDISELYEYLKSRGVRRGKEAEVMTWPDAALWDFLDGSIEKFPTALDAKPSTFSFLVNDQLSGRPAPCPGEACRLSSTNDLVRFALLYADRVAVQQPLVHFAPKGMAMMDEKGVVTELPPPPRSHWTERAKSSLVTELRILHELEPLAQAKMLGFIPPESSLCPLCIYRLDQSKSLSRFSPDPWHKKVSAMVDYLYDAFRKRTKVTVERTVFGLDLVLTGDAGLVEHGKQYHHGYTIPASLSRRAENAPVALKHSQVLKYKLLDGYIERIIQDMEVVNAHAGDSRFSYLTSREIDLELIQRSELGADAIANAKMVQALAHDVPYVDGLSTTALLKLRQSEGESFNVYRDAVTAILRQHRTSSAKELRQAVEDTVQPELNRIARTLKESRSLAAKSIAQQVLVVGGSVSIGVFGGLISKELSGLVGAIGGLSGISKITDKIPELWRPPKDVMESKFYFLWRAKSAAQKAARRSAK